MPRPVFIALLNDILKKRFLFEPLFGSAGAFSIALIGGSYPTCRRITINYAIDFTIKSGAGERVRTLDTNFGKVRSEWLLSGIRVYCGSVRHEAQRSLLFGNLAY